MTIPFVLTGAVASVTASADRSIIGGYAGSTKMESKITVEALDTSATLLPPPWPPR